MFRILLDLHRRSLLHRNHQIYWLLGLPHQEGRAAGDVVPFPFDQDAKLKVNETAQDARLSSSSEVAAMQRAKRRARTMMNSRERERESKKGAGTVRQVVRGRTA